MTPNYYESYDIGLTREGTYEEIFNSDKDVYGGTNNYNGLPLMSYYYGPEEKPHKICVKMGGYAAMIFKYAHKNGQPAEDTKVVSPVNAAAKK